jgi:type I restriction enzyme S subunit
VSGAGLAAARSRFRSYPSYRESGTEWLEAIPNHWKATRLREIGTFSKGRGGSKVDEVAEGVPCVRYGDLYTTHRGMITETRRHVAPERADAYTSIRYGDVLFAASGETLEEIGKSAVCLMRSEVRCGGDVIIFRPHPEFEPRYLGYAADSTPAVAQKAFMGTGSIIKHIDVGQLKQLVLAIPPVVEQRVIAQALDRETATIDALMAKKERLIELLAEHRVALINRAVTKGLDPTVPMKDSGVAWLGEVPALWDVVRSRRLFAQRNQKALSTDVHLSASQEHGVIPQTRFMELERRRLVQVVTGAEILKHVETNDFIISMRSFQGGIEWSNNSGAVSSAYVVLTPVPGVDPRFFSYLLKSTQYIRALQSTSNLVRDGQALRFEQFALVDLPLVPLNEQVAIAGFLQEQTLRIDALVGRVKEAIGRLKELRTAVISSAVTGKIDLREQPVA